MTLGLDLPINSHCAIFLSLSFLLLFCAVMSKSVACHKKGKAKNTGIGSISLFKPPSQTGEFAVLTGPVSAWTNLLWATNKTR